MAINARDEGFKGNILPKQNAKEAAVISELEVYSLKNIGQVVDFFFGDYYARRVRVDLDKQFLQQTNHFR